MKSRSDGLIAVICIPGYVDALPEGILKVVDFLEGNELLQQWVPDELLGLFIVRAKVAGASKAVMWLHLVGFSFFSKAAGWGTPMTPFVVWWLLVGWEWVSDYCRSQAADFT